MPTSSANATSGCTLNAEVWAPRSPTSSCTVATANTVFGCDTPFRARAVSAAMAQPIRLSHALAMYTLGLAITANGDSGRMGSPGRMSSRLRTSQSEVAPTSMNISRTSSTFLRSSSRSSCGGLEPTTPSTSPLRVLMMSRCASTTCPHQPPSGRNLTKPSLVTDFTMKPTSSRCPASMTRGLSLEPRFSQMKLPSRSLVIGPTSLRWLCMTRATLRSKPGAPCASTRSFRNCWVRSMETPLRSGPGRHRPAPAAGLLEREIEHALHYLLVRHAGRLRGHGNQAGGRHARNGIHFETPRRALRVEPEIHARHPAAVEHPRRGHPQRAHVLGQGLFEIGGAEIFRAAGRVLGLVVVEPALGPDLDDRKRLHAQHRHGELAALDVALEQDFLAEARRLPERGRECLPLLHDRKPDRRAFLVGLDHQREPEPPDLGRRLAREECSRERLVGPHQQPRRRRDPGLLEHPLGHRLVDRDRARHHPRAGVGLAGEIEQCLERAVLPGAPVERNQHHLGVADRGGAHQRRGSRRNDGALRDRALLLVARRQQPPVGRVHRQHLVPELAQRLRHPAPGAQRDLALRRGPAHQYRDLHPGPLVTRVAALSRATQRARPSSSATSGSSGPCVRPVKAARTGWNSSRPLRPSVLPSDWTADLTCSPFHSARPSAAAASASQSSAARGDSSAACASGSNVRGSARKGASSLGRSARVPRLPRIASSSAVRRAGSRARASSGRNACPAASIAAPLAWWR